MKRYNSATRLRQLTRVEKICRYLLEMARCKIKNLLQQMKSFSQTEAGAGTALALSHVFGSMRLRKLAHSIGNNSLKSDELLEIYLA